MCVLVREQPGCERQETWRYILTAPASVKRSVLEVYFSMVLGTYPSLHRSPTLAESGLLFIGMVDI